jgi:hypothetical protein
MRRPLILIVLAQLFGTSLWFTGNSAAADLKTAWGLDDSDIGSLVMAVQLGFITGTLLFSLTGFRLPGATQCGSMICCSQPPRTTFSECRLGNSPT